MFMLPFKNNIICGLHLYTAIDVSICFGTAVVLLDGAAPM